MTSRSVIARVVKTPHLIDTHFVILIIYRVPQRVEIRPQIWSDLEAVVVHHSKPRTFVLTGFVEQEIRKVWDTK